MAFKKMYEILFYGTGLTRQLMVGELETFNVKRNYSVHDKLIKDAEVETNSPWCFC